LVSHGHFGLHAPRVRRVRALPVPDPQLVGVRVMRHPRRLQLGHPLLEQVPGRQVAAPLHRFQPRNTNPSHCRLHTLITHASRSIYTDPATSTAATSPTPDTAPAAARFRYVLIAPPPVHSTGPCTSGHPNPQALRNGSANTSPPPHAPAHPYGSQCSRHVSTYTTNI